jgi:hypothetical protein
MYPIYAAVQAPKWIETSTAFLSMKDFVSNNFVLSPFGWNLDRSLPLYCGVTLDRGLT